MIVSFSKNMSWCFIATPYTYSYFIFILYLKGNEKSNSEQFNNKIMDTYVMTQRKRLENTNPKI